MNRKGFLALFLCLATVPAVGQYRAASIRNACSSTTYEWIANVSFGSLNNASLWTPTPAYTDYTGLTPPSLQFGVASTITVSTRAPGFGAFLIAYPPMTYTIP